jgi:hypothetical protein
MFIWRNLQTADLARLMETVASAVRRQTPAAPNDDPVWRGPPSRHGSPPGKRSLASGGNAAD